MDNFISKDVQNSLDANSSGRTDGRKRKCETTHLEQRNNKLHCKDSPVYDLVQQSKENSFNLLNLKRKPKRKLDFKQGRVL